MRRYNVKRHKLATLVLNTAGQAKERVPSVYRRRSLLEVPRCAPAYITFLTCWHLDRVIWVEGEKCADALNTRRWLHRYLYNRRELVRLQRRRLHQYDFLSTERTKSLSYGLTMIRQVRSWLILFRTLALAAGAEISDDADTTNGQARRLGCV